MPSVTPVDVVVVTYNPGETITGFLDSIAPAGGAASVTVVDNASRDDAPAAAAASAGATFIQTGRNAGYGAAANIGAAQRILNLVECAAIEKEGVAFAPYQDGIAVDDPWGNRIIFR